MLPCLYFIVKEEKRRRCTKVMITHYTFFIDLNLLQQDNPLQHSVYFILKGNLYTAVKKQVKITMSSKLIQLL